MTERDSDLDMELNSETVHLLRQFRKGNDPNLPGGKVTDLASGAVDYIRSLSNRTKGLVIIDLLTIVNALEQSGHIMQTDYMAAMEKLKENGIE